MTQAASINVVGAMNITDSQPSNLQSPPKTVWYLGGNHAAKLLTSVDGDLDPDMLAKLAGVPAVIGELALSVESLVSDDLTVGGFENDLLAQIAANTLDARKRAQAQANASTEAENNPSMPTAVPPSQPSSSAPPTESLVTTNASSSSAVTFSVPNPLLEVYDPVPNPLARITPPGSPTPATTETSNKRKESPTHHGGEHQQQQTKVMRRSPGDDSTQTR